MQKKQITWYDKHGGKSKLESNKYKGGTAPPPVNPKKELSQIARPVKLKKLPEEILEQQEKERLNGKKPEPPKASKIPRPMNDKRAVMVGNMFNRENAMAAAESFKPAEWDIDDMWLNPDNRNEIQPDKLVVFFGKRRTGKSFCARHLAYTGRALFNYGMVLCDTKFNQYWQKYFPRDYVHEFDPIILRMFIEQQGKEVESWILAGEPRKWNPYKLIILDDVVSPNFRYVEEITTFATKGRHYRTCVFLMTQYPRLIATSTRVNTDFAFIFFQQNILEKEAIASEYLNMIPKETAMHLVEKFTQVEEDDQQRSILVVNLMANTIELERKLFTYAPTDPGEFVIGSPDFWKEDSRYHRLLAKGAFDAWITYNLAVTGERQVL